MSWLRETLLRGLSFSQYLHSRLNDTDGQTVAEYVMIAAVLLLAAIVGALFFFQDTIAAQFTRASDCFDGSC